MTDYSMATHAVGVQTMRNPHVRPPIAGTAADDRDMKRMKKPQELNRVFTVTTMVCYAVIIGLTWPFALCTGTLVLTNGGPAGALWVFLAVCCGMGASVLSMAEMASLEPTAGGQYHWVGAFAPPSLQKPASYIVGWLCALGWQSAVAGPANVGASIAVGFAVVANSSYVPQNWHIVALTILIISWATIFNVFFARKLPAIEAAAFTLYILVFFAFVIVMFAIGPRSGAKEMFTDFQDNAGWGSIGAACFVGVSGPVIVIIGSDSSVHLAEELKDAARQLPKAMLASAGINYVLGFVTLVAFVAVVGNVEDVLASPTGQPFIQVLLNITQSSKATMAMTFFVVFIFAVGVVNANTTSSRQLYAFSRDGGLPFSRWISYVSPDKHVPIHAVLLSWCIGSGLALIPLGSTAAFINIQTIGNSGILSSYMICIACRIYHRNTVGVYGTLSAKPPFSLGMWGGNIINTIAVLCQFCFFVSGMFPVAPKPDVSSMNWSSFAWGATVIIAMTVYIRLRKTYLGAGGGNEVVEGFEPQMDSKGPETSETCIQAGKV